MAEHPSSMLGPKPRLRLIAKKGPFVGKIFSVFRNELLIDSSSKKSSKKSVGKKKDAVVTEENDYTFEPYAYHEHQDSTIYGWAEFKPEYGKRFVWMFNLCNKEIYHIAQHKNLNTDAKKKLLIDMYKEIQDDLDSAISRYKQVVSSLSFADESLNKKYLDSMNYVLNERFELVIRKYIQKFHKLCRA